MARVFLDKVNKIFANGVHAVKDVTLEAKDGEFLVLVGPSGCGKSTVLRMVAGLEKVTSGKIAIGDRVVNNLEPKHRDVAMVFQDYALYPHMSVRENLEFGLIMRKMKKSERAEKVESAAKILGLTDLLDRRPAQLSGGQKQRVAVGRAIVREPKVFLFDEPLSNLDAKLRAEMRTEIARLHQRLGVTTIYVTHDQVEAMTLGERIIMMESGTIQQVGSPLSVYEKPVNRFVAGFLGTPPMNFIEGEVVVGEKTGFTLADYLLPIPDSCKALILGLPVNASTYGIRPEHIKIVPAKGGDAFASGIPGEIVVVEPLGSRSIVILKIGKQELTAEVEPDDWLQPKSHVFMTVDGSHGHLFNREGWNLTGSQVSFS